MGVADCRSFLEFNDDQIKFAREYFTSMFIRAVEGIGNAITRCCSRALQDAAEIACVLTNNELTCDFTRRVTDLRRLSHF